MTSASGSAVETQPTIWTTWQHSPEDTFFIMAISSRKFVTSRSSAPPTQNRWRAEHLVYCTPLIVMASTFHKAVNIINMLCTFQKFDGHCVWWFPTVSLSCYELLGWCCGNIHGEHTFVDLAIVPFSQLVSYFEMRDAYFPLVTFGGQELQQCWRKLWLEWDICLHLCNSAQWSTVRHWQGYIM